MVMKCSPPHRRVCGFAFAPPSLVGLDGDCAPQEVRGIDDLRRIRDLEVAQAKKYKVSQSPLLRLTSIPLHVRNFTRYLPRSHTAC